MPDGVLFILKPFLISSLLPLQSKYDSLSNSYYTPDKSRDTNL